MTRHHGSLVGLIVIAMGIGIGGTILFCNLTWKTLDNPPSPVYTPIHQHQCFSYKQPEAWETTPIGRIEQVGEQRVLVTLGKDHKPWKAQDAWMYGWSIDRAAFERLYKEVPCPRP